MKRVILLSFVVLLVLSLQVLPASAATCESLSGLKLPDTTITAAESVIAEDPLVAGDVDRDSRDFGNRVLIRQPVCGIFRSSLAAANSSSLKPISPISKSSSCRAVGAFRKSSSSHPTSARAATQYGGDLAPGRR